MPADNLMVGGLVPLTTVDFPNRLSAVVFCQGCPWRCHYCHNPHLLSRKAESPVPWRQIRDFLKKRQGFLDAVVFSGGEPLMQAAIEDAVAEVKAQGFHIALHTGGSDPERFARLLPSLDWVGFDIKAPFDAYPRITCIADSGKAARDSLGHLLAAGTAYEVRTTVDPRLLTDNDLLHMAADLDALGADRWILQECREPGEDGNAPPVPGRNPLDDQGFLSALGKIFPRLDVRRS